MCVRTALIRLSGLKNYKKKTNKDMKLGEICVRQDSEECEGIYIYITYM